MSAAVISGVAVMACTSHRSTRDGGHDAAKIVEIADNHYRVDVTFCVDATRTIDAEDFLQYIMKYKTKTDE